jgi:hypothetical protein
MENLPFFVPLFGLAGLAIAFITYRRIVLEPGGEGRVAEIAGQIHDGAMVFMRRELLLIGAFAVVVEGVAEPLARDITAAIAPPTIGIGAGQMSRVDAVRIAIEKAKSHGHDTGGAVLASDAFFPFADNVALARAAGVAAIVQPGGSVRDGEVIAAADEAGIAMIFTHRRHFRHRRHDGHERPVFEALHPQPTTRVGLPVPPHETSHDSHPS